MKEMKKKYFLAWTEFLALAVMFIVAALFTGCENTESDASDDPPPPNKIIAFSIGDTEGVIDADTRTVEVKLPNDPLPDLTNLTPTITHTGASISPASGVAQNFYQNGFTPVTYTLTADDRSTEEWTVTVRLEPLAAVAAVGNYLIGASGWGEEEKPVPLPLAINMEDDWTGILSAIQTADKYVAVDLSECTMTETEFDPGTANTGKNKIVSLVLPDAALSVKAGVNYSSPTFKNFTSLASVSGKNITSIGGYAFFQCSKLTIISFPATTNIDSYSFTYCTALSTVELPLATSIGSNAFTGCKALSTISLPSATSIGEYAFCNCTALSTVSLPLATSISDYAFSFGMYSFPILTTLSLPSATSIGKRVFGGISSLSTLDLPSVTSIGALSFFEDGGSKDNTTPLTVNLPAKAPTLSTEDRSAMSSFEKNVTVNVPSGATGYDDTWQDNFKKAFGIDAEVTDLTGAVTKTRDVTINLTINTQ